MKLLKACVDQHQVIASGDEGLTMDDAAYLMAEYGGSLPKTLVMARSVHTHLQAVLETLLGRDHLTAHGMDALSKSIME